MVDPFILATIISIVLLIILYKFAKGALRIIGFAMFLLTVILAIVSIFIFMDIRDFKNHARDPTLQLLLRNNHIAAGLHMSPDSSGPLTDEEIAEANKNYIFGDLESIRQNNYKIYLIDYSALASDIALAGTKTPESEIAAILDSNATAERKSSILSSLIFNKAIEDPFFIFTEYRLGRVYVYPQTPLFTFMKYVPGMVLEKAKMMVSTKNKENGTESSVVYERVK